MKRANIISGRIDVYNGSIALSNEHQILKDKKEFIFFLIADARTILDEMCKSFM